MTDARPRISHTVRRLLAPGLALVLLLLLAGCVLLNPKPPDPLAEYRPALRPGFSLPRADLDAMPQYSITLDVDPTNGVYTGTMEVAFRITGVAPLTELYFRLYPNLRQLDGSMEVSNARMNGISANYAYTVGHTAVHMVMPAPLKQGDAAQAHFGFTGKLPRHADGGYTLYGTSEGVLTLSNFYPILAPRRDAGWALDVPDPQGDVGFHDAALYRVRVTAPAGQVIVASGTSVAAHMAGADRVTYDFVQGPAREFTLLLSPRYRVEVADAYGTEVRSYFYEEDAEAGHSALYDAVSALQVYNDQFGPYPYRALDVVEAPINFRGQEFPGLILVGSQTYSKYLTDLENRVVHEVGHQWWYNQVGSDQTTAPWLDEGLTEFTMYYYYAARYGPPVAEALRRSRWSAPVQLAVAGGRDAPLGQPVAQFTNSNYETMVYAKGALFFATLRDDIGPERFNALLRTYLERYRWRIARPGDFEDLADEVAGRDLSALFTQWLGPAH